MYKLLFNSVKQRIPRISPTEMIALQAGLRLWIEIY